MTKKYLGDGVYVQIYGDFLILTTEDGLEITNTIILEPEVFSALVYWADLVRGSRTIQEVDETSNE
jgi:hypothetical protein